jgi:acetyl esterase/lipase
MRMMTEDDLGALAAAPAGLRIAYGNDANQFGELTLPAGAGYFPVIVNVHGGCWLAEYDIAHSRAQAQALAQAGFAVWNVEYRRVGNGGEWPGTFVDVGAGADYLRQLAAQYPLDLRKTIAMGHSAGGHLALWLGARARLPHGAPLYVDNPLPLSGIVALAPATDLPLLHQRHAFDNVVDKLLGGSPEVWPQRYDAAMPSRQLPLGVPQVLIAGEQDAQWREFSLSYMAAAQAAGDTQVRYYPVADAGHFESIAPGSRAWPLVVEQVRALVA